MLNQKTQFGRSMVEMLGVLAIVGVLSMGGIAGYTKAMAKYRVHKALTQISTISSGIKTAYASKKGNYTGCGNVDLLLKLKIVTQDMIGETTTAGMSNPPISEEDFDNYVDDNDHTLCMNLSMNGVLPDGSHGLCACDIAMGYMEIGDCEYDTTFGDPGPEYLGKVREVLFGSTARMIKNPFGGATAVTGAQDAYSIAMNNVPEAACVSLSTIGLNSLKGYTTIFVNGTSTTGKNVAQCTALCTGSNNTLTFIFN